MSDLIYTNIQHIPRKKHWLTLNEYCLCDMVYHLSNNPERERCNKSRKNFWYDLWLTERSIVNLIEKMVKKWLIARDENTKYLKSTVLWYNDFVIKNDDNEEKRKSFYEESSVKKFQCEYEKSSSMGWKKFSVGGEKSSYNNNIYIYKDNYINNNNINCSEKFSKAINDFIEHRIFIKNKISEKWLELIFKKLKEFSEEEIINAIEYAIINWYQWVFPKKILKQNVVIADNNANDEKHISEISQEIYSLYPHKYADDKNTCCEKIDKLLLSFSIDDIKTEVIRKKFLVDADEKALEFLPKFSNWLDRFCLTPIPQIVVECRSIIDYWLKKFLNEDDRQSYWKELIKTYWNYNRVKRMDIQRAVTASRWPSLKEQLFW